MEANLKIYTKKGDKGKTSLLFGKVVSKDNPRVEAYGSIDELNAAIGLAAAFADNEIKQLLNTVQNQLFYIGTELASYKTFTKRTKESSITFKLDKDQVEKLEKWIDNISDQLPTINEFVLPSGTKTSSFLHFARTVCRRAERETVKLSKKEAINPLIVTYLNRLSDLLFVLARFANQKEGEEEVFWKKD